MIDKQQKVSALKYIFCSKAENKQDLSQYIFGKFEVILLIFFIFFYIGIQVPKSENYSLAAKNISKFPNLV